MDKFDHVWKGKWDESKCRASVRDCTGPVLLIPSEVASNIYLMGVIADESARMKFDDGWEGY